MNPLALLPYVLGAYGGYQGYRGAKESGASGLGRILGGAIGAYGGYNLGQIGGFAQQAGFQAPSFLQSIPGIQTTQRTIPGTTTPSMSPTEMVKRGLTAPSSKDVTERGILDILFKKKGTDEYDPLKIAGLAATVPYVMGAFNNQPTDVYMPGYNMSYLELQKQRPGYTFIDPITGQEKAYEKVYAPEEQGRGQPTIGNYSLQKTRLKTGGLAEIKKFNEGGINYLPSKVSHDEDDANNYVRARGYVEDGSGNGDKDEDTMLAQLADGEFVTRADGVLGAGIIAGANPNSMKDMREKGAQYFYEQQKRFKRIFDLLEEKNGNSKQKAN